jgi:membrane-bound ClpP family serine protease
MPFFQKIIEKINNNNELLVIILETPGSVIEIVENMLI